MEGNVLNINGISNSQVIFSQASVSARNLEGSSEKLAVQEVGGANLNVAEERPFYEYQKEPWLNDPGFEDLSDLESYVIQKGLFEHLYLASAMHTNDSFMKSLAETHPELASKRFGLTLGGDASIKIIDYDDGLTEADEFALAEAVNEFEDFKYKLQSVAKCIMTLVDHDYKTFGGRYKLDLENFQYVIDLSKVLKASAEQQHDEWVQQVHWGAEKRESLRIALEV